MKISKIQPAQVNQTYHKSARKLETPPTKPQPTDTISFKGGGTGALIGSTGGILTTLLAIGATAITGGLALPGILATGAIIGGATVGAVVGDKIEDKIDDFTKTADKDCEIDG